MDTPDHRTLATEALALESAALDAQGLNTTNEAWARLHNFAEDYLSTLARRVIELEDRVTLLSMDLAMAKLEYDTPSEEQAEAFVHAMNRAAVAVEREECFQSAWSLYNDCNERELAEPSDDYKDGWQEAVDAVGQAIRSRSTP